MTTLQLKLALNCQQTFSETIECLSDNISLKNEGAFDVNSLFQILVRAASTGKTIEQTARELKEIPCSNTIRYHLNKINDFPGLEAELNSALKSRIPKGIKNNKHVLAIDLNLIPYYGEPSSSELPYIYRSQAKNGTWSFYAYASLYVIKKGKRVNLAIRGVRWLDTIISNNYLSFS